VVKPESRGSIFAIFSLVGSLGVLLINKLGGELYDHRSHVWPFALSVGSYVILFGLTLGLGLCGKLRV